MRIDNIDMMDRRPLTADDSAEEVNLRSAMQLLNWTFRKDKTYQCAVGNRVATEGQYAVSGDDSTLTMMPSSKSGIKTYTIKTLTEDELVLRGIMSDAMLSIHFKAHD